MDNADEITELMVEGARRARLVEINSEPSERDKLKQTYGTVWDTSELSAEFEVIGFAAPFAVVRRKSDGKKGSVEFQHSPRFYFNYVEDK
jgi:hypothetical protein